MTAADGVVLVLNAGFSSVELCAVARSGDSLERTLRGQVSGIGASPHLVARHGCELLE